MSNPSKICPQCGTLYHGAATFCQVEGAALLDYAPPHDPLVGTVLLDQFRVDEVIGQGGMGRVYRAHQTTLGRDVAIKVLHRELVANKDAFRRFQQEARLATSINHEHLVQVYLFGQLPDGSLYLVMELLEGRSLAAVLRDDGQLPLDRALRIAYDVSCAVGAAHAQGIIHRDVKPENVMMVNRGGDGDFAKVLDFGIARVITDEAQNRMTQSGVIFGTARYISPEGAAGEDTDARSDVYSLAVMAYQLLCHEPPLDAKTPVALLMKHLHEKPKNIRKRRGGAHVPPPVADVVMRGLNKNPDARHDNGVEFARALERAATSVGLSWRAGVGKTQGDVRSSKTLVQSPGSTSPIQPPAERQAISTENDGTQQRRIGQKTSRGFMAHQAEAAPIVAPPPAQPAMPSPVVQAPVAAAAVAQPAPQPQPYAAHSAGPMTQAMLAGAPNAYAGSGDTAMMHVPGLARPRQSRVWMLLAAFLVGGMLMGVGGWVMHSRGQSEREEQLAGLESRAREALAHGAIDTPPGENVTALTDRLLELDPNHAGARALRREAALLLREQAATALTRGEVEEARAAYQRVLHLFPEDPAAQAGLANLSTAVAGRPGSMQAGGGRAGIQVDPATPAARTRVRLIGMFGPEMRLPADVVPEFTIYRGSRRVHRTSASPGEVSGAWVADYTFTRTGEYEVTLEFGVGGQRVMLREVVRVGAAARPTTTSRPSTGRRTRRPGGNGTIDPGSPSAPLPPPPGGSTGGAGFGPPPTIEPATPGPTPGFRPLGPPMEAPAAPPPPSMVEPDDGIDWTPPPSDEAPPAPWTGE